MFYQCLTKIKYVVDRKSIDSSFIRNIPEYAGAGVDRLSGHTGGGLPGGR